MTYTFIGEKDYIQKEIDKLSKSFNSENIVTYDIDNTDIKKVIEDLNTISLFGDKLVIANNIDKVTDPLPLVKYLEYESDNTLILVSLKELDNRKNFTKVLKAKTKFKEFWNYNLEDLIKDNLDDYKMELIAINTLISYCSGDVNRILNELEKLKIFKLNEKEITREDIGKIVKKSYDATIFDLIDEINKKNTEGIFNIYNNLINEGEEIEKILYTISNHYRLLLQICIKTESISDNEIIKEYKMHPYRLKKLKEQLNFISKNDIASFLKKLSEVDISVKSGKRDIDTAMFLLFNSL